MSETTETMVHDAKYEVTTIDDEASASTMVAELLASVESPEDSTLRSSLEIPPSVTEEDQPSFPIPVEDAAPSVDIDHRSEIDGVDISRDLSEIEGVDALNHKLSDLNGIEIINQKSDLNGVDIINHNLPELDDVNIVNHTSELEGDNPNHNSEPNGININDNYLSELNDDADIITHKCKLGFVDTNHTSELDGITNKPDLSELDDVEIVHNNLNELDDDTINHKSELNGVDIHESSSDTVEISQILITESKDLEDKSAEEEEEKPLAEVISTSEDDVREVVEGVPTYANILEVSPGSEEISEAIMDAESSLQEGDMNGIDEEGLTVVPSQQESMVSTEGDVEASSASNSNEEEYVKSRGLHEETVTLVPAIEEDDKSELTEVDTQSTLPRVSSCTISKDEHDMNPNEEEEEALTLVPTQQEEASSEVEYVESNGEEVLSAFDPPTQDDTNANTEGDIDASLPSSAKESLNSIEHYNSTLSKIEDIETSVTESEDDRASTLPVISPSANGLNEAHVNPNDQEEESPLVQSVKSLGDDIVSTFEDVTGLHQKDSKEEINQCLEESCDEESRSTNTNHEGIPGEDEIPSSVDVPPDDVVSPSPHEIPIEKPLSPENAIETADNQISVLKPEAVLETPTSSTFDLVSPDPHEIPIEKPLSIEEPIENADSQNLMLAYEIYPETPISSTFDLVSPDPDEISIEKPRSTEEPIENGDSENSMLASEVVPGTPTNSTIDLVSPTPHEIPIEKALSPEEPLENAESNQASVLASEIVPETPASTIDSVSPTPHEISKGETLSPEGPIENAGNQNSVLAPEIVAETPASTIDSVSLTPHIEISKEETLSPEEPIEHTGNQNSVVASEIVQETNQNSMVASEIVLETLSSAVEKLCNGSPPLPKACGDASADEGSQELIMMSYAQQEVKEQLVPTINLEELEEGNLGSPDQSTDGPNEDEKLIEQIPFEEEARKFKETKLYGQSSCNSSYFDGYDEIPQQAQGSKVNEIIDENEVEKHVESGVSSRSFVAPSLDGLEEHSRAREDEQIHLGLEECSHEATNGDEGVGPGENGDHILDKEQDYSKTDNNVIGKEKVRFRMKLPLLVTGIAIAAVGVAVASIGRSH